MLFQKLVPGSIITLGSVWYKVMSKSKTGFLIEHYVTRESFNLTEQDFDNQGFSILYTPGQSA